MWVATTIGKQNWAILLNGKFSLKAEIVSHFNLPGGWRGAFDRVGSPCSEGKIHLELKVALLLFAKVHISSLNGAFLCCRETCGGSCGPNPNPPGALKCSWVPHSTVIVVVAVSGHLPHPSPHHCSYLHLSQSPIRTLGTTGIEYLCRVFCVTFCFLRFFMLIAILKDSCCRIPQIFPSKGK